jgi:hypothetical protein
VQVKQGGNSKAVCLIAAMLAEVLCLSCGEPSPDRALRAVFTQNEAEFEKLKSMVVSDVTFRLISRTQVHKEGLRWVDPRTPGALGKVGISEARYAEYLKIFNDLGLDEILQDSGPTFYLRAVNPAFARGDHWKGYAYSPLGFGPLEDDLDSYASQSPHWWVFSHLKGNWYLYKRQSEPSP